MISPSDVGKISKRPCFNAFSNELHQVDASKRITPHGTHLRSLFQWGLVLLSGVSPPHPTLFSTKAKHIFQPTTSRQSWCTIANKVCIVVEIKDEICFRPLMRQQKNMDRSKANRQVIEEYVTGVGHILVWLSESVLRSVCTGQRLHACPSSTSKIQQGEARTCRVSRG